MRSFLLALGLSSAILITSPAFAQYANRSIGASVGLLKLNQQGGLDYGLPLGLLYTNFLTDLNLDVTLRAQLMLLRDPVLNRYIIGATPSVGVRYLFSQESIRPYIGLDVTYLHIFYDTNNASVANLVGASPNAGVDFFLNGSFSVGLHVQFTLYPMLNDQWQSSFGGTVDVATYY